MISSSSFPPGDHSHRSRNSSKSIYGSVMVAELPAPALELAAAVAGVVGVVLATIVDLVVVATLEIYNKN